jgi:hypothetical protein
VAYQLTLIRGRIEQRGDRCVPSRLTLPGHVVNHWRLGKEVVGNCFEVAMLRYLRPSSMTSRMAPLTRLCSGVAPVFSNSTMSSLSHLPIPVVGSGVILGTS